MTLITTNTESGDASSSFTSSIDSTYKLYIFKFIDVNPATDEVDFTFQGSTDSGSNYNVTVTSTYFDASLTEGDTSGFSYRAGRDLAQSTSYQHLMGSMGNGGDESGVGTLWLFNPSNTTYVKHFFTRTVSYYSTPGAYDAYAAGYFNTTSAIDAIQFKMSSGNMDAVIKMYGVG